MTHQYNVTVFYAGVPKGYTEDPQVRKDAPMEFIYLFTYQLYYILSTILYLFD